jgi:hypothetical protein
VAGGFETVGRGGLAGADGEPGAVRAEADGVRLGGGPEATGVGPALVELFCGRAPALPDEAAHPAASGTSRAATARRVAAAVEMAQRAFTLRP